ncbi:MAG: transposase [Pseudomonadota bacterium]
MARAFIAKAVYNMNTTRELIDRLKNSPALRRICGWEKVDDVPHESSQKALLFKF